MSDNKNGLCGVYKPTGIISASSNIVEIIGGAGLEFAFKDLNMDAKCTYKSEQLPFHVEVWEVSANDFKTLCDYSDEEWKDVWGWWRQGHCVYHGNIYNDYIVNGKMMYGYEPAECEDYEQQPYDSFYNYFRHVHNLSTFYNFCYFAISLADDNRMKVSEFLKEYQP